MRSTLVFAAVMTAAGMAACGVPGPVGPVVNEHHAVERGAATSAKVDIDMTAGDLDLAAGAAALLDGDFDYNVPALKPEIAYAVNGTTGTLKVSQGSTSGNYENR